jgi:dipeptidyl aminopeptidase/acylaminoacyl peptidase
MIKTKIKGNSIYTLSILIFSFFVVFGICGLCAEEKTAIFKQDLSLLENSNGKIVEQKKVDLPPIFSSKVDCSKMKYLSDGLKVVGFILAPKARKRKFPVLIYNRGGNREFSSISKEGLIYLAYLASNGYVVLASQYRGNDGGEGQESFGGSDVNDVLNLIPLAKSLKFSDADKIVMLGFSRGGMMTYLAIKNGAKIRAAAVVGGITDLGQTYRERELDMKHVIEELVGTKESDWRDRSAYYFPEKINVPVLILHGEDDFRVDVSQAKKFAEKLHELGKEYELIIFPDGDHALDTNYSERDAKILEFFAKHLR